MRCAKLGFTITIILLVIIYLILYFLFDYLFGFRDNKMIYIIFCSVSFGFFMIFLKYIDKKCINNMIHSSIENDNNQDLIINEYNSPTIEINIISKKKNSNNFNQFLYTPNVSDIINLYCPANIATFVICDCVESVSNSIIFA